MADLGDLSGERRDELWKSFEFGARIREMIASSPLRDLQASITADMRAQRELLSAFTMPKFEAFTMPRLEALEALRMPPVLDSFRNFGIEMAAVSSRIEQMRASIVGHFSEQSSLLIEKMRAEAAQVAALQVPTITDSLRLAGLMPLPPLPSIAQSFATLTDIDWRDEEEVLRERVTQLEEQVRELQAQFNPPEQPQPPEPPDDPTLHTGQYL